MQRPIISEEKVESHGWSVKLRGGKDNAKHLYEFLGVSKGFSSWVKFQPARCQFVEERDYIVFTNIGENPIGGRPKTEHDFTLEAGKHTGIMNGTDKRFEVRGYFIECESRIKQ